MSACGRALVGESTAGGDVAQPDQGWLDLDSDGGRRVGQIDMDAAGGQGVEATGEEDQMPPRVRSVLDQPEQARVAFDAPGEL